MKRIMLLIGILVVLVVFLVLPLPAEQDEPNITEPVAAESNVVEPNIVEPNVWKQKTLIIEKTDLRVVVKQLEKRIAQLENLVEYLLKDNMANKADIEGIQSYLNIMKKNVNTPPPRRKELPSYRPPAPVKHRGGIVPQNK